uniref:Homeobox protein Hox-A3-like n=1 Tax=Fundulus heteroclitus TaxID=8078 RepID=A0A3Q2T2M8_FUNHE
MAEWKTQVTYNYNPSFQAYAYSLVYQPTPGINHGALAGWGDNGDTGLDSCNVAVTQTLHAAVDTTTVTGDEFPSGSPDTEPVAGDCYPGTELVFLDEDQEGHMLLAGPPRESYGGEGSEAKRARSGSFSDSEAHTSPDSWSSVISREGSLPQVDPTTWAEKGVEPVIRSPGGNEDVSSSLMEEAQNLAIQGSQAISNSMPARASLPAPSRLGIATATNPKAKVRVAFTESQMNALVQRFSIQRYLTPAEMKNLAEVTGLTYKQVKTWFQNRRMKLRRHQKDTSWVSERYATRKDGPVHRTIFSNMRSRMPPYDGDGRPQFREHYNHHMMEAAFAKSPQNLAYYLAAMGGAGGSGGYPPWSANGPLAAVPNRPHPARWPVPQGGAPFDYSPNAFNTNNYAHAASFDGTEGGAVTTAVRPDGNQ